MPTAHKTSLPELIKHNRLLSVALSITVIFFISFFLFHLYKAFSYRTVEQTDFHNNSFKKKAGQNLFINENAGDSTKFLETIIINDVHTKKIIGSPISFIWKPKHFIFSKQFDQTIDVSVTLQSNTPWYLEVSPRSTKTTSGTTTPQRYQLYYPGLKNYSLAASFSDVSVYAKEAKSWTPKDTLVEWVKENVPPFSQIRLLEGIRPFGVADFANPMIGFDPNTVKTSFPGSIRGPHSFYVFLNNEVDIAFKKQDLNWFKGEDTAAIVIRDVYGEEILRQALEDDGVDAAKPDMFRLPQQYQILKPLPYTGIYRIDFEDINETLQKDWAITSFVINTNKIVFDGSPIFTSPISLYTQIHQKKTISVRRMKSDAPEVISFTGTSTTTVDLSKIGTAGQKDIELEAGSYTIQPADYTELRGSFFSFDEGHYFDPFIYYLTDRKDADIVIGNYTFIKNPIDPDWITVKKSFKSSTLMPESGKFTESVEFLLSSPLMEKNQILLEELLTKNYFQLEEQDNVVLWGKKKINENFFDSMTSAELDTLEPHQLIEFNSLEELSKKVEGINPGIEAGSDITTVLSLPLRGTHIFLVYTTDMIDLTIHKEDLNREEGADMASVAISNFGSDKVLCETTIADDGNISSDKRTGAREGRLLCENIPEGIYTVTVSGEDFLIKKMKINTNKIMLKNKLFVHDTGTDYTIYTQPVVPNSIDMRHWGPQQKLAVTLPTQEERLLTLNDGERKKIELPSGLSSFRFSPGSNLLIGGHFSFNEQYLFDLPILQGKNFVLTRLTPPETLQSFKLEV